MSRRNVNSAFFQRLYRLFKRCSSIAELTIDVHFEMKAEIFKEAMGDISVKEVKIEKDFVLRSRLT